MTSQDAYSPQQIADRVSSVGVVKARLNFWSTFVLAMLAGAFIALGAIFFTVATMEITISRSFTLLIGGLAFSLGLILVVVAGAELFTGNNLVIMAFVGRKITLAQLLRNWIIVYLGNFVGALLTSAILYLSRTWAFNDNLFGVRALMIANHKVGLDFTSAFFLGALANALVCLAVWLVMGGRTVTDRILATIFPISAFVASSFEHSVANMYFVSFGLFMSGEVEVVETASANLSLNLSNLNLFGFLIGSLLPSTLGNIVGGAFMVGLVYWFVYLRKPPA